MNSSQKKAVLKPVVIIFSMHQLTHLNLVFCNIVVNGLENTIGKIIRKCLMKLVKFQLYYSIVLKIQRQKICNVSSIWKQELNLKMWLQKKKQKYYLKSIIIVQVQWSMLHLYMLKQILFVFLIWDDRFILLKKMDIK